MVYLPYMPLNVPSEVTQANLLGVSGSFQIQQDLMGGPTTGSASTLDLSATGLALTSKLTEQSGYAALTYASVLNLGATGSAFALAHDTLSGFATGISGVLRSQINALSGTPVQPYSITYTAGAGFTATTMGNAINFPSASAGYVAYADLSRFTGVCLSAVKLATAGTTTGALFLGFLGNFSTTAANYSLLTSPPQMLAINVTNTLINSGYAPITAAARSGVYIALMTSGGNATLSPVFGMITASFK